MIHAPAVVDSVLATIGRTPVVRLRRLAEGCADVFVKLEYFNPAACGNRESAFHMS